MNQPARPLPLMLSRMVPRALPQVLPRALPRMVPQTLLQALPRTLPRALPAVLAAVICACAAHALPACAQAVAGAGAHISANAANVVNVTNVAEAGAHGQLAAQGAGNVFQFFEPLAKTGVDGIFAFLGQQQWVFILLALALGYPLGRLKLGPVSLGSTASVLLVAVLLSMGAQAGFGLTYAIPDIISTVFLTLFMYALGLGTGPKFFAGLKSTGIPTIIIGVIIWALNWIICVFGARLAGLESGFSAGLMSGSYTITAILGVAQSAIQSGSAHMPAGMTPGQAGANMAAGYAISYVISSIGIILLMRYLPQMFRHDPVTDAKAAERRFAGTGTHALPGTPQAFLLGHSAFDIRTYQVTHDALTGKSVLALFEAYPQAPVLRVVRANTVLNLLDNPVLQRDDIIAIRADVGELILDGGKIGPEVDAPKARDIDIEVADIVVGASTVAGLRLEELDRRHLAYGLRLVAIFRAGQEIPLGPKTDVRRHDVLRLSGPAFLVERAARTLGGRAITEKTLATTEVTWLSIAMAIGYIAGALSITIAGIPFALGTSAGCLLAGIFVAYLRSRNPQFGGPVSEGARSFLQDVGLNIFVAALGANVGPKIIGALGGNTVIWLALIGGAAALLPVVVAYFIGDKLLKMNSIVNAGACAGGRNSTPSLNAVLDQSQSQVAAVPFPVAYAITTVLALIGGYIAQIIS